MTNSTATVRQNYWAILLAAIACFVLEAAWYITFQQSWLVGIGRTEKMLMASGDSPVLKYGVALVAAAVVAAAISRIVQFTGEQTAFRGIKVAAMLWVGFVLTTWSTEYVFEVRPLSLYAINEGFWLLGMAAMGAIVGGWRRKAKA